MSAPIARVSGSADRTPGAAVGTEWSCEMAGAGVLPLPGVEARPSHGLSRGRGLKRFGAGESWRFRARWNRANQLCHDPVL